MLTTYVFLGLCCLSSQVRGEAVPAPFRALPSYPSPYGGWAPEWGASYAKARLLVEQMTLAEKVNITSGTGLLMDRCVGNTGSIPRLSFPQLCLQDSALGVRDTDNVTAFPAGITTGATWDKSLMLQRGIALGQEFRGKGAGVYLGPTVGPLGRKPRGGRNWEGFGADPVLQAVGGAATIKGVQSQGVMATIKHFIGNEQEMYRMYNVIQPGISSNIDDRVLHELYMWPFAEGIRAGVTSVMAAYNAVNGSACSQNSYLLNHLLKDELGFQGFVMSDWLAQISGVSSALSGLDMAMPGDTMIPLFGNSYWMYEMSRSVLNASVPVDRLDDMATRIAAAWYQVSQDADFPKPNFSSWTGKATGQLHPASVISADVTVNEFVDVQADHANVARQIAQDAITLLKLEENVLPLTNSTPLFIFGTDAAVNPAGPNACADRTCDTGTLGMGWGSGTANYPFFDDPLSALKKRAANVTSYITDSFPSSIPTSNPNDTAIVFISSDSGENQNTVEGNHGDRDALGLATWHNGDKLVQDAAAKYANVIVVAHTVGPIIMESWIDLPSVKAVFVAHLPGQEAGESLTNVLYGDVSPSGHLPYTIPKAETDYPASVSLVGFEIGQPQDTYSEGLYMDYRHFNKAGIRPRFAFGHGLSYTNFTFSNATINKVTQLNTVPPAVQSKPSAMLDTYNTTIPSPSEAIQPTGFSPYWRYLYPWLSASDAASAVTAGQASKYAYPDGYSTNQSLSHPPAGGGSGGNPALWDVAYTINLTITNTGSTYSGRAVAQLYVQFPASDYDTPIIQLRDFEKTDILAPGQSQVVQLSLTRKDVSVWDVQRQNWVVPVVEGAYKFWVGQASDDLGIACGADTLSCETAMTGPV